MKNINIRKLYYHARHRWLTTNNLVIVVALFIAASWAWGSVGVLQRNYALQREVDSKHRQLRLLELENDTLRFQQKYYQSEEYQELEVRRRLGLVFPGEKVLVLPPNTAAAKAAGAQPTEQRRAPATQPSNAERWVQFLFGGRAEGLQD